MTSKFAAIVILLLGASGAAAQQERELLEEVDPIYAHQLEEYNWAEIQEASYFASRYRIVRGNVDLLREEEDIFLTPFDDVAPIRLRAEKVQFHSEENFYWAGRLDNQFRIPVLFSALAWDLDEAGNALVSNQNRFEFSPFWTFDEFDNPILDVPAGNSPQAGVIRDPGPPPQTPEQIERHKWLRTLDKRAFFSVTSVFEVPGGSKYVLSALRFTPKYSIIYEIPRGTFIPVVIDLMPGETVRWNDRQKRISKEYRAFIDSLPKDEKPVRGDLQ